MFELLGVDAVFTENGADALEMLRKERFDLLILDMQMPGMSGIDVINMYNQTTDEVDRTPVVVITGDATADMRHECEQLGVRSFLPKPVGVERMRGLLGHYMLLGNNILAST